MIGLSTVSVLVGGIGLFLLGMGMMTAGLKLAAGDGLRKLLDSWTRTSLRGLVAGAGITAIVQSSSAVTVATVGFVNAGLLSLSQAIWVIFGTNVGTTMTGWLVALVGIKVDVGALALPMLGVGMLMRLVAGANVRSAGFGEAVAGFGAFFLGIGFMQSGFAELTPLVAARDLSATGLAALLGFVAGGAVMTILTQSSSAAIAITLTATAGGVIPLDLAAGTVIGTNIGTTSTALFACIGATPAARRVAAAHVAFNMLTAAAALLLLPVLLAASVPLAGLVAERGDVPASLAVFHTLFNCFGVVLIWPLAPWLVRRLSGLFRTPDEEAGRPRYLDATLAAVPALALRGLVRELERMLALAFAGARARMAGQRDRSAYLGVQRSVTRLGVAVREFVGRLSGAPLPADVAEALPDLLRAVQHVEDLVQVVADLGDAPPPAFAAHGGDAALSLRAAVRDSIGVPPSPTDADALPTDRIATTGQRVESTYQAVKTALLRATARGELTVAAMEDALLYARSLRRAADAAGKAERRLARWRNPGSPLVHE